MAPTSTNGNKASAPPADLGELITKERLPAGRQSLAEPLVARSQRERILVSMAQSCATKGYVATTIADICEPAGVSRATFYELFKDKEACFHAAMELSLADAMGTIVEAYSPDKPWATMVRDATAAFLKLLAERPAFARMALVEAPSSGERAFELYASGKRVLLALLDKGRDDPLEDEAHPLQRRARRHLRRRVPDRRPDPRRQHRAPARAAAGHRLHHRRPLPRPGGGPAPVARGREDGAQRGVGRWRGGKRPREADARWRPPSGRHRLPREVVVQSQRERLLDAMIRVVAEKGYAATTIADVTRAAGVSRTTFYELFDDKEACFLAAYDRMVDTLVRRVTAAYERQDTQWPERARVGLAALLEALAAEPELARLAFVDVGAAGPAAQRRYRAAVQRFTPLFDEGRDFAPGGRALPPNTSRMAIGGVTGLIADELVAGRAKQLPDLLSDALFATLMPYVGPYAAAREVGETTR